MYWSSTTEDAATAHANYPGSRNATHIWLNKDTNEGRFDEGRYGYGSLIHELGHAFVSKYFGCAGRRSLASRRDWYGNFNGDHGIGGHAWRSMDRSKRR